MCECELCLVTPWSDCTERSHVATLRGLWAQAGNITSSLLANMYTLITVCPALLLALLVHPGALLLPEAEAWAGSCSWALTNSKKESQHSESEPTLQPHTVQSRPELRLWPPPWQAVFKLEFTRGALVRWIAVLRTSSFTGGGRGLLGHLSLADSLFSQWSPAQVPLPSSVSPSLNPSQPQLSASTYFTWESKFYLTGCELAVSL